MNMKKKIQSILMLAIALTSIHAEKKEQGIVLTSEVVKFIDGKSFGINDEVIGLMLQVRRDIKRMQFGQPIKGQRSKGIYSFRNEDHSVRSLAVIENNLDHQFYQQHEVITNHSTHRSGDKELNAIEKEYYTIKKALGTVLELAKIDFQNHVGHFLQSARTTKDQTLVLIAESCKKRNRHDSLLLAWAEAQGEEEVAIFNSKIRTFNDLDQFYTDIVHFFEDLIRSCPIAWEQFKQRVKKSHK